MDKGSPGEEGLFCREPAGRACIGETGQDIVQTYKKTGKPVDAQ